MDVCHRITWTDWQFEEIPTVKKLGVQGIFGLNLDEMQIIEVPVIAGNSKITENAITHLFSITLHEICHFFYYKSQLFRNHFGEKHIVEEDVRHLIAEGIATALGNGAFSERLGNQDPQWYADSDIDSFAHKIFPELKNYLDESKPLDASIANLLVKLARENLSKRKETA